MLKHMYLYLFNNLKKTLSYIYKLSILSLLLYFINIKASYSYINPGIIGMFLQFLVAGLGLIWLFFSKFKKGINSLYKKITKRKTLDP